MDQMEMRAKLNKLVKDTISIDVKYFNKDIEPIKYILGGNWVDLRSAIDVDLKAGEFKLIPLGIGMKIPDGYEAHIVPRSSTFKKYGIIQTNHMGVIDGPEYISGKGGYCGDDDQWMMPVYAIRDTHIGFNDRICQFRIVEQQPPLMFNTVEHLEDNSRGGFGSTGTN